MDKSLLDTDIFSEVQKGINLKVSANATVYYREFGCYTLSVITVAEIVSGWHKRQREDRIQEFLVELVAAEVLLLDQQSAVLAGRMYADLERAGQPIGSADSAIAAIALQNGLTLVTGNSKHYQRIQTLGYDLKLNNWRI